MLDGKKILMTGVTGQVGAGVVRKLVPRCEVWGLARYSRPGSREEAEALGVRPVFGDFATGDLSQVPEDIDYVLHFAANTYPGTAEVGMVQNAEGTGLLMHQCRNAKAFLHVSTTGVYVDNPDPHHRYKETDHIGNPTTYSPNYAATKIAAEGIVRALARAYNLPSIICRLDCAYGGPYDDGGLPGTHIDLLAKGEVINLPTKPCMHSPVHEDDLAAHIEPLLKAASVPAVVVNWGGHEAVSLEEWVRYMSEVTGIQPKIEYNDKKPWPNCITDTTHGREIGLEWRVHWKDGFRRMIQERHPELQLREPA
jgi:nucleoside-diphosphate-sugar epimerase